MRATSDEYWNTSLPKDHDALRELDAYCQEWGGLTRAEATRRLLIEWTLRRQGKDLSAWEPNGSARFAASGVSEGGNRRTGGGMQKPHLSNTTAKAASQVLLSFVIEKLQYGGLCQITAIFLNWTGTAQPAILRTI